MDIDNKVKNLIKWGRQTNIAKDIEQTSTKTSLADEGYQTAQINILGQSKNVKNLTPYGLYNSPPVGSEWTIFSNRGNSDDLCGIANDYKGRFKGLKEGEVALVNLNTGSRIYLKEDNSIEIDSKGTIDIKSVGNVNLTAPTTNITGNVNFSGGDFDFSGGTFTINGIVFDIHVHGGVQSGGSSSGGPQ